MDIFLRIIKLVDNILKELVSIVIPLFNSKNFILATLKSVIQQTYKNFEIILVDDCSNDNSLSLIKSFKNKNKKIKINILSSNLKSGCPSIPRNIGIKAAKGKYIAFLDSDDIWHPEKLALQINALKKSKSYMCSTFSLDFRDDDYKKYLKKNIKNNNYQFISLFDQMIKYRTPTSSILIHAKIAKKHLFDENLFYKGKEDLKNSLLMHSKYGPSIKCYNNLLFYRNHQNQTSKKKVSMFCKTIYILLFTKLYKANFLRLFTPLFVFTNIILYFYYRILCKKL